jgi:hypothetical protein
MKTFYDIRELSPARDKWRPLEARVLLISRRKYLVKVIASEHPRCTDLISKYIVCPKDEYLDKDLHITTSFWSALKNFIFKKVEKYPEFPEELL